MRILLKRLFKMIIGYGAVQWAGPFISLLFTKIITQIASPADYGSAGLIYAFVTGIAAFALYTVPSALTAHYNDNDDPTWKRRMAGSALLCGVVFGFIVGAILFLFAPQITPLITRDATDTSLLQLSSPLVLMLVCSAMFVSTSQVAMRVRWGMLFSLTAIAASILSNVVLIVVFHLAAIGIVVAPIVSSTAICLMALLVARPLFGRPTRASLVLLLRSSIWLLPTAISLWILNSSDRLFLAQVVDKASIGHYEIAVKIASLLGVLMSPLYSAITPLALSLQHDPLVKDRYVALARYLVGTALAASLLLGLFSTEILLVLTRAEYLPAAPYVGLLTYVHVITAIGGMLTVNQMANKRLMQLGLIMVAGAVTNLILNAILIPWQGVWGAASATVIGMAVPVLLNYLESRRRRALPYPMRIFMLAIFAQIIILWIGSWVPSMYFPARIGIKLLIFLMLPVAFIGLGLISRMELQQGKLFIESRFKTAFSR